LPKLDPGRWGFDVAYDTLARQPLTFVRGMIAGGTSGGEVAYYILAHLAPTHERLWAAMARYYQAPSQMPDVSTFGVEGCLLIEDDRLGYVVVPDPTAAARTFIDGYQEDYAPDEHLVRKSGFYGLDAAGRVTYAAPPDSQLSRLCSEAVAS
jgi:hypothetical protein